MDVMSYRSLVMGREKFVIPSADGLVVHCWHVEVIRWSCGALGWVSGRSTGARGDSNNEFDMFAKDLWILKV